MNFISLLDNPDDSLIKDPRFGSFLGQCMADHFMGVEPKIGVLFHPNHPFVHRVFPYFHHPFWGKTPPIFGNTLVSCDLYLIQLFKLRI